MTQLPPGLAPRLVAFCEELRGEGVAVGTSEILDAFSALETVPWTEPADFREALAATLSRARLRTGPRPVTPSSGLVSSRLISTGIGRASKAATNGLCRLPGTNSTR